MRRRNRFAGASLTAVLALMMACGGPPGDGAPPPAAPTNVTATPGAGFVTVAWEHDGANATGFAIYRERVDTDPAMVVLHTRVGRDGSELVSVAPSADASVRPLDLEAIATVDAEARSYRDDDVEPGASYRYAVAARGSGARESSTAAHEGAPVVPAPAPEADPRPVGENPDPSRYLAVLVQDDDGNAIPGAAVSAALVPGGDSARPRSAFGWTDDDGVALVVDLEEHTWIDAGTYAAIVSIDIRGRGIAGVVGRYDTVEVPGTLAVATDDTRFVDLTITLAGAEEEHASLTFVGAIDDWQVGGRFMSVPVAGALIRSQAGAYELGITAMATPGVSAYLWQDIDVSDASDVVIDVAAAPTFSVTAAFESTVDGMDASRVNVCPLPVRDRFWMAGWRCLGAATARMTPHEYQLELSYSLEASDATWSYYLGVERQAYGPAGESLDVAIGGASTFVIESLEPVYRPGDRVTFDGGLFDRGDLPFTDILRREDGLSRPVLLELRILDPSGDVVHSRFGSGRLLRQPFVHEFILPSDAAGGTYTTEARWDTGPYLGALTATTTFLVDAPGEPPALTTSTLWQTDGFTGSVTGLVWDEDRGRVIASGVGGVRAFDATSGDDGWVFDACMSRPCSVSDVFFGPDDTLLATVDRGVGVLDPDTGALLEMVIPGPFERSVRQTAMSPDGLLLLTFNSDRTLSLWDTDTWTERWTSDTGDDRDDLIVSLAVSPDGTRLASGRLDGRVTLHDAEDGSVTFTFTNHTGGDRSGSVSGIAWHPDGLLIASGGGDRRARVWQATDGTELAALELGAIPRRVNGVAWSPDGEYLAAVGSDGALIIQGAVAVWQVEGWELEWSTMLDGPDGSARIVTWSPDGATLATGDALRRVTTWDAASGEIEWVRQGDANNAGSIAWSPSGARFVSGTVDDNGVLVWSVSGELVASLRADEGPESNIGRSTLAVDWSRDGSKILSAHLEGGVSLWDAATFEVIYTRARHDPAWSVGTVNAVAFSPDGARFATANSDATASVAATLDGNPLLSLSGHTEQVHDVVWSPDGERIATASSDGTVRVWDAATAETLLVLEADPRRAFAAAWSPDGSVLATGGDGGTATLWDPLTGDLLRELQSNTWDHLYSLSWHPDGGILAGGGYGEPVQVWDVSTGGGKVLDTGTRSSISLGWSPDGRYLAVATKNPAITLHEVVLATP